MAVLQFDIDGVLADFVQGFLRYGEQVLGMALPAVSDATNSRYGTGHLIGEENSNAIWQALLQDPMFWEGLPAAVDQPVFDRVNAMQDQHTVYFVTNRMGMYAKAQTENWLGKRGIENPTVVLTGKKGEFAHAVGATHAIEDKAGNAVYIAYQSPKTKSYILSRLYNRFDPTTLGSKVTRVYTVSGFLNDVEDV